MSASSQTTSGTPSAFVAAARRGDPKSATIGLQPGAKLATWMTLEFFPEHTRAESYVGVKLSGEPFRVPAGTQAVVIDRMNDRSLVKVSQPRVGYRFIVRDEYISEGEKAPPDVARRARADAVAEPAVVAAA